MYSTGHRRILALGILVIGGGLLILAAAAAAKTAPARSFNAPSDRASQVILGAARGAYVAEAGYGKAVLQVQSTGNFKVNDIDVNIWPCYEGANAPVPASLMLVGRPRHMNAANEDLTNPDGQGWTLRWHINQVPAFGHPLNLALNFNVPLVSYVGTNQVVYTYPYRCVEISVSSPADFSSGPQTYLRWSTGGGKGGK